MKHGGQQPGAEDRGSRAVTEDDADADTTAQLRAMRSVWLSMRDEDPPDGGLVDLLSAARAKADTMRAQPTLRQRLAAWVRRPPALAFATVVVLVGGAVLVLGRSRVHRGADLAAGSSGAITERAPQAEAIAHGSGVVGSETAETASHEAAANRDDVEVGRARLVDEEPGAPGRKQLEQLYAQCASAARRGDCAAVRTMFRKIAETDRGYRARVAKDAAVARCLARAEDTADGLAE